MCLSKSSAKWFVPQLRLSTLRLMRKASERFRKARAALQRKQEQPQVTPGTEVSHSDCFVIGLDDEDGGNDSENNGDGDKQVRSVEQLRSVECKDKSGATRGTISIAEVPERSTRISVEVDIAAAAACCC